MAIAAPYGIMIIKTLDQIIVPQGKGCLCCAIMGVLSSPGCIVRNTVARSDRLQQPRTMELQDDPCRVLPPPDVRHLEEVLRPSFLVIFPRPAFKSGLFQPLSREQAELCLIAEWVRIPVLLIHTTVKRASRV